MSTIKQVIALVDDEPGTLRGLQRVLDARGYSTRVFNSGEQFLESSETIDAACVILDIHLSGMSGIETRHALCARGSEVPVIFMTALDSAAVRNEAIASGCAAFLRKPFSGQQLIDAIRNATAAE